MPDLSQIPEILSYGVAGLGFLIALLAFYLLKGEQAHETPRPSILKSISGFMAFGLIICVLGLVASIVPSKPIVDPVITVDPKPESDLSFVGLEIEPKVPKVGEPTTIRVSVKNKGPQEADEFQVSWWADSRNEQPTKTWIVQGLSANEQKDLAVLYPGFETARTDHLTRVEIDPGRRINDPARDNNRWQRSIRIAPDSPPLPSSPAQIVSIKPSEQEQFEVSGQSATMVIRYQFQSASTLQITPLDQQKRPVCRMAWQARAGGRVWSPSPGSEMRLDGLSGQGSADLQFKSLKACRIRFLRLELERGGQLQILEDRPVDISWRN